MNLSSLLLTIISKLNGERTIYAGLHLLRGKRSGQTLQDIEYYNLKMFFGVIPKLSTQVFDDAADELRRSDLIFIDDTLIVHITDIGKNALKELPAYRFNGWDYRGREEIFFARLSLVVQTVSNFRVDSKVFMPAQRDTEVQLFVKEILRGQPINELGFSNNLKEEIIQMIELSQMREIQKTIVTHRLVGYGYTGWTWDQLAEKLDMPAIAVKLFFIESLHLLLDAIEKSNTTPLVKKIAEGIKVVSHLTDSSMKTRDLFERGLSMEEIAITRRLKMSTIEDHFVEMAINSADFPIEQFVTGKDLALVSQKSQELGTKRLRLLKDGFPELSYFQLRLILGVAPGGEMKWTSNQS